MQDCPCGSGASLAACCGPVIAGGPARTAEALMRSRYTAYALRDLDHIERTLAQLIKQGELSRRMPVRAAALGLHSLLEGLFQNWMLDPGAFDLVRTAPR